MYPEHENTEQQIDDWLVAEQKQGENQKRALFIVKATEG